MECKERTSKKKLILRKEKLIRKIDYDSLTIASSGGQKSQLVLGVEILQNNPIGQGPSQKVLVSIKPRSPRIKTIYLAEKDRFNTNKRTHKSTSRQAIGDHKSLLTPYSTENSGLINSASYTAGDVLTEENKSVQQYLISRDQSSNSEITAKCLQPVILSQECNLNYQTKISHEKCYVYGQPHIIMNLPKKVLENCENTKKVDTATLTSRNSSSEETFISLGILKKLQKKIDNLERKILNQEMVLQSIDSNIPTSSSDEETKEKMRTTVIGHPGCSYIEQYSHVPETSAFQRYTQQPASVSANKGTNIGKDHNSEQYGRDFTTYDGITARGRRQSSSVPGKRDDIPKMAAERVHKIRHKLNPVRDYRLMDTVHYLAQGEFAPRDDGIKLTPSREAVLSDIIWEDVCRTHWPNARLARRQYNDRYSSRFELQRLIDNLLRERVAHVERRRRRHYRIVKLNHRHESCRPMGKTGDIIVASHKSRPSNEDREIRTINKNVASAILANSKREERNPRKIHKSNDRITYPWLRRKKYKQNDCSPGPSSAVYQSTTRNEPTNCYQTSKLNKKVKNTETAQATNKTSESALSKDNANLKIPRLVVKKDSLRRKYSFRQKPNLDHFILLPTLVVRTPSNMKRQRKFNELYHRVLNVQTNNDQSNVTHPEKSEQKTNPGLNKKDVGLNINITLSKSEENISDCWTMNNVTKCPKDRYITKNGLYIHYNFPKLLKDVTAARLRYWTLRGEESKLERAVLSGHGHRLLAEAEALPLPHHVVHLIGRCDAMHAAVEKGSLLELKGLLDMDYNRNKSVTCYDEAGVGLLHKAVFYNYMDIVKWLVENFPHLVQQRDSEGRTALHYTAACRDEAEAASLLQGAGAVRGARDFAGRTLAHYRVARTLLALPAADMPQPAPKNPPGLAIKRHNIRIWCHECDMGRLQRVVWEGHGTRLLSEVSSQPIVKRFLEAVPYIMNTIRDIHNAVIQNDLEGLMRLTADPVSPQVLSSKDLNGMTALHKAAGFGHCGILKYIIEKYPRGINDVDSDGRTPLHYAATVKDEQHTYNTLVELGADESVVDNKNKSPGYYINRPQEIDKGLLKTLPDAPRTPSSAYPTSWDWKLLDADYNKKPRKKNLKASNENISSKNNTSTLSEMTESQPNAMKNSSTHELISALPELDDAEKAKINKNQNKEEHLNDNEVSEEVEEKMSEENIHEETSADNTDENLSETQNNLRKDDVNNDSNSHDEKDIKINDDKSLLTEENTKIDDDVTCEVKRTDDQSNKNSLNSATNESTLEHEEESDGKHNDVEENDKETEKLSEVIYEHHEKSNDKINDIKNKLENNEELGKNNPEHNTKSFNQEDNENENEDIDKKHEKREMNYIGDADIPEPIENKATNGESKTDSKENCFYSENTDPMLEETNTKGKEGNNNTNNNEDDDDVQVQDKSNVESNDVIEKCAGNISENNTTKGENNYPSFGNLINGRNTQESLIEGIIRGDAEQDSQDASMTEKDISVHGEILIVDNEIDPEVSDLINNANMEMLATLVLNGEGSRLIGRRSQNTELQAFLENVPSYMQKINRVHVAAKEGNIRDLQTALDRRKFAIARDPISPNGATPLHVATVFGKTNIIKYLGGRFPETLSAVDFEGRTALHYAAVIPDNGHYYNLLQQLGANAKDLDDNGQSAEDYLNNPYLLPYEQLLADYGVTREAAQIILSDKGKNHAVNGHMDIPAFQTEEGRYLAKSLGDPLIKGLTEVANVKPKDPVAFLASFLHNFPENEKPRLNTQESNMIVTSQAPDVENEQPAPQSPIQKETRQSQSVRSAAKTAVRHQRPIEVITLDPKSEVSPEAVENAFSSVSRDEHGQSMLHFAAARTHANNALFQLLQESDVSLGSRDELYRTARDVSIQANIPENTVEIDKWVLHLAARGKSEKIMELLLQGYDHILDIVDSEGASITDVVLQRGDTEMSNLLSSIPAFEESRESLHVAVRQGDLATVRDIVTAEGGRTLARSHNTFGRTALHVAVLAQHEDIVTYLAETCPELLRIGDNLERTPLHYAMGVDKIESLSRVLIRAGSKRVLKDLKGRQPSYYFMNKSDILRLKEEEEAY